MTPAPPKKKHRLLLELGRGGMGVVFVATSEERGLFVVKQLKADLARDPEFPLMLADEARIAARIVHPNVVRTIGAGFDGRHHYIEMELLEGQALDSLMRADPPLPLSLAVRVLARTLDGLHAAHELTDDSGRPLGVVHRDVSPHNVVVTYAGDVKVLDFGVAKAADSLSRTRTGMIKGKARYMAPEQAVRGRIDRRADVFAVGLMLWEVLAGRRVWGDMPDQEIVAALENGTTPSPRAHRPDVPERLDAICMRAIATRADDRFATAAEMARALDEWRAENGDAAERSDLARWVSERFAVERATLTREIAEARERAASSTPRRSRAPGWIAVAIALVGAASFAIVRARTPSTSIVASASSSAAHVRECAHNVDCRERASPSVCRVADGACVTLASIDCRIEADDAIVASDATLWVGTMFPLTGPDATAFGTANAQAADLARRELMDIAHGIPSQSDGGVARPLGIVSCDDAIDPGRAARHLVDDLHVPAVIGFRTSGEVLDLATTLFIPNGVLTLPALNRSALIRDLPHPPGSPRLVFRTTLSLAESTPVTVAVVRDLLEPALRARGGALGREPMRVALLRNSAIASRSLADALTEQLRFNGKSLLENGEKLFKDFTFPDDGTANAALYAELAASIAAFRPNVIVHVNRQFVRELIEPIETSWPRDARTRPYYVLGGAPWEGESFLAFLGTNAERRRRFLGMSTPTRTPANLKFVARFNQASAQKVTLADAPNSAYDAFYLVALAAFAAGDDARLGSDFARAIRRLVPPGKPIDLGPDGVLSAFATLREGGNVDLQGASGTLDFDLATGEPTDDFVVLCIGVDAAGRATDPFESGAVYDAQSKTMRGALRCP